ncbi:MAG: BrnT family toxin [Gammaproteobacteria bacterium]|nr:BrnT family toxin [Gammaproteobacteria bacterium]
MAGEFHYHFEWDPAKAATNRRKHGVGFELAATVFRDSLALSRFNEDHSETEERWVTLGQADNGNLLVVVHTFQELNEHNAVVRIISARAATKHEQRDYESKP